jgi:hypothetical protein
VPPSRPQEPSNSAGPSISIRSTIRSASPSLTISNRNRPFSPGAISSSSTVCAGAIEMSGNGRSTPSPRTGIDTRGRSSSLVSSSRRVWYLRKVGGVKSTRTSAVSSGASDRSTAPSTSTNSVDSSRSPETSSVFLPALLIVNTPRPVSGGPTGPTSTRSGANVNTGYRSTTL